jgi:hypothetical protein
MSSFTDTASQAVQLFRIRYPVPSGAALSMDLEGHHVAIRELTAGGSTYRRFWVKVTQGAHVESIQMELRNGRLQRNCAAPDGAMMVRD